MKISKFRTHKNQLKFFKQFKRISTAKRSHSF